MNQVLPIQNLDQMGVVPDAPPSALPPNAFSDARNVRFRDGAVRKIEGEVLIHAIVEDDDLDTKYGTSGNTLGAAKYVAYWPNPNLGDLNAYYIYVIAVKNSSNVHIADRVYLIDQEGNRKDVTPTSLTNADGYKGFDPDGVWQHTLFSGGFAIIINNGIEKPHYILDPINTVNVNNVDEFSELPGWDSYNIDIEVISLTWDSTQSYNFDLGQKVDFTNFYVTFTVNGTAYAVQSGSPAGTGTPNGANFVPGELPSSGITTSSNNFEIYNSSATNTTVLASTNLSNNDKIVINIVSRNDVTVRAGIVRSFGNLLVAGDLVEVDSVSGDTLRRLTGAVRTSDLAVTGSIPNNWNPFEEGVSTADEFTLSDTNIVKEMQSIQGNLYIYTNSSIHAMTLTGNANAPVAFNLVTENYGALTTEAVTEYDGKHLVVGSNDIYIFPGHPGNIQSVATGRIRDYFYKNLNPLHELKLFTLLNKAKDEIWICYPTIKSVTGEIDEAIIWNYRLNNWTIRDLDEVIAGDIAPIRGGGIPVSTVTMTSGNSGSNTALNTGRQEVQTMTISGQMEASHSGINQVQEVTITQPQKGYNRRVSGIQINYSNLGDYTASKFISVDQPETIGIDIRGNSGPNIVEAEFAVSIGNSTYGTITTQSSDTLFTRSSAPFGGLEIVFQLVNDTIPTDVLITAADLFPTNDGLAKTQQQTVEALADYINAVPASHALYDFTATAVEYWHDPSGTPTAFRLFLESDVPGERNFSQTNSYINSYVGGLVSATGTGSDQEVSVTAALENQTPTGYARGTGTRVPYYDTNKGFELDYGNSGYNDTNGHTTGKDSKNGLQVFIGGWTSAGAGGPDGSNRNDSYTVSRTGNLYFIVVGGGGCGADHNYGGGASSAVQGYIEAQAGDTISVTSGFAPRRDTYGGGAGGGGASRIRWYRGSTLKADITAPGGKGAPSNSSPAGQANAVTPSSAPAGVVYQLVYRGEGSTGTVMSGETDRGGSRNGGRGFFTLYGSNLYNGRWSPSSLSWRPREANFGDGTQSHSDTPACCTWNAVPPGVVYLWQDGVKTNFTVTNNRTVGSHALQQDLYNLQLSAGGSVIGYLETGDTVTRSVDGNHVSNLAWSGQILGTQMSSFTITGTGDATNVSGTGIDVDVTQNGAVYDINVTNNYIAPSTIATPSAIADTDFQIGEVKNLLGQASDTWTITGTYLTNTGTNTSVLVNVDYGFNSGSPNSNGQPGNGVYGVSEANSPPVSVRIQMPSGGYVPDGFDKRIQLTRSQASSEGISEEIVAGLITDPIFQGQDPRDPNSVQPSTAYFYVQDDASSNLVNLIAVKPINSDVDTASLSVTTLTTHNGTDYAGNKFGGGLTLYGLTTTQGTDVSAVAPTLRLSYDNTYTDVILYGRQLYNDDIARIIANALDATGTWSAYHTNVDTTYTYQVNQYQTLTTVMRTGKIIATREQASTNSNVITVTIQNDPSNLLKDITTHYSSVFPNDGPNDGLFPQTMTFAETTAGQNPSIGQGTATLTLGASQFLPAYNVVVPLTGAYNTTLSSSDIASLIRNTNISGWTLSGTGSDVIFTTDEKYSVNRTDNGLGTGTVQSLLWTMTADDDNGNFDVPSDPLQNATAAETTSGIRVRYSQPTVIRVNYSDSTFQDYVFGGNSNGPRPLSDPYVANIYTGGSSNSTYTNVQIADKLETEIKKIGGRTLAVERTGNSLRISPLQFSTTGLYVTSITQTYLGTTAPTTLAVTIPNPVTDATLSATYSSFGIFDPDRPWASDQVKGGTAYPIFIQTDNTDESNRIRAADVGFNFGGDPTNNIIGSPYISYVERRELGITPELDTEEIARAAIQSTGGTATELDGPLYYPTLRLRMSPTNYTAEMANLQGGASVVNDYVVASTYKVDTRITGRFANYRIDDANEDPTVASNEYSWGIPSVQFEINKAGER